MTDELRVRIAKALGWSFYRIAYPWDGVELPTRPLPPSEVLPEGAEYTDWDNIDWTGYPDWTGNVGDALELAEMFDRWTLDKAVQSVGGETFYSFSAHRFIDGERSGIYGVTDDSPALAICRAWLKAFEETGA